MKKINWLKEGIALLKYVANEESIYDEINKLLKKRHITINEEWKNKLKVYKKIDNEASKAFKNYKEDLTFYFKCISEEKLCLSDLLFFPRQNIPFYKLDELVSKMEKETEEQKCSDFCNSIEVWGAGIPVKEEHTDFKTINDVIKKIDESSLDFQTKWKIQMAFLEKKERLKVIVKLIQISINLLLPYETEWKKWIDNFYKYWLKMTKSNSIYHIFEEYLGLSFNESKNGTCIYPLFIEIGNIEFYSDDEKDINYCGKSIFAIYIGFSDYYPITLLKNKELEDDIYDSMKLLSDPSKAQILKFISNKWAYGVEIAKKMNLTTPTISHHMTALVRCNLVEIKQIDNKLYFRQNSQRLKEILNKYMEFVQ